MLPIASWYYKAVKSSKANIKILWGVSVCIVDVNLVHSEFAFHNS